jgi:uncharacterized protein YjlB
VKNERINTNPEIMHFICRKNHPFPNNELPVVLYRQALCLPKQKNRAADIIQQIVRRHGWSNTWRNGIYNFHHYHSNTHECMVVAMGSAVLVIGGPDGKSIHLQPGDSLILPAGVAHLCTSYSKDFLCVGCYPQGKNYDLNYGTSAELKRALPRIAKLSVPAADPIYGEEGFLRSLWKKQTT